MHWVGCDIGGSDAFDRLTTAFTGADVVVHLAWMIQPSHDRARLARTNIVGTRTVIDATVAADVPALVYASSVGAYSPGPKDRGVDESWPTEGIPSSSYSVDKATTERMLDELERRHPDLRVVRLRPGLIFQAQAGSEIARYFLGPLVPRALLRAGRLPVVPDIPGLRFQAVHADDVARAYLLAVTRNVRGPFNIAADPVLDPPRLAELLSARLVPAPARAVRGLVSAGWRARLQPTDPGWVDLALGSPLMDISRAHNELGWHPQRTAADALLELLRGLSGSEGGPTPPLHATVSRAAELARTLLRGGAGAQDR